MTAFTSTRTVRFADCDPAGIVFFPQYLVMLNTLVEQWFDDGLRIPYAGLIGARRTGLPTVRLEVDFTAVSRHGDVLRQQLSVARLGHSSMTLAVEFLGGGDQTRLRARQVLVCTSLDTHRPLPLPADVRKALGPFIVQDNTP
jgi:4-hydroxybenzoyl-CoA thioesterase